MKSNKALWFLSFLISLTAMGLSIFVFLSFMKKQQISDISAEEPFQKDEEIIEENYYQPQDNVGAVTFTEDQITEIARNIFSCDDFLNDVDVELERDKIGITAKIKDVEKLIETYPELEKYKSVITPLQNKKISVEGAVKNEKGNAAISIKSVTVGNMEIDGAILSPFIEQDDFSRLFDVDFNNIELTKDAVVFKNGVPDILKY